MNYEQPTNLFPGPEIHVLTSPVSDTAIPSLSMREAASVIDVIDKRRREFATARALAREGLKRFYNIDDFDLINGEDRVPIWPQGISGSISHSSTRAWVALCDTTHGTIGIDGENRSGLDRNLWHLTLDKDEITYLETLPPALRERRALVIFSAKEALYKAQYPRTLQFLDFMAVTVTINNNGSLQCIFRRNVPPFHRLFTANGFWHDNDEVVTGIYIPGH